MPLINSLTHHPLFSHPSILTLSLTLLSSRHNLPDNPPGYPCDGLSLPRPASVPGACRRCQRRTRHTEHLRSVYQCQDVERHGAFVADTGKLYTIYILFICTSKLSDKQATREASSYSYQIIVLSDNCPVL